LGAYLRQLYLAGAFRGATEEDAFFVRCDETLNPPQVVDAGQLITEIGVAPTEPLEFIVLQLSRDGDGTLSMKEKEE
jgi:phage tail sheath protein FI